MFFLVLFCIKILSKVNNILIIIQRSNGDVFLSSNLINALFKYYESPRIDLIVNDDTLQIASLLENVNLIHKFSYRKKIENRWKQEKTILSKIYRKYDLSINLTASDRSVLYALFASKRSISAVEKDKYKSWWKKLLLKNYYYFDSNNHILINNSKPLECIGIKHKVIQNSPRISNKAVSSIKQKLKKIGVENFIIFHPSAQYEYKIYPKNLRNQLINNINQLGIPLIVTGGKNEIDSKIKDEIPLGDNIHNFIGKTSLEEYFALSKLSSGYIGMDTLNMHIAASQNKPIFAIFGSTNLSMWSPWSNALQKATTKNSPIQKYSNITIFQSQTACHICGVFGCGNNHGIDKFNFDINPKSVFKEIKKWYENEYILKNI